MSHSRRFSLAIVSTCIQVPLLAIIFFGEFGFYFPGPMGSWGDWILWIFVYTALLVLGIVATSFERRPWLAVIQVIAPIILGFGYWLYVTIPEPHYAAAEYQFLVGKTLEEVEHTLGRRRLGGTGIDGYLREVTKKGESVEYGTQHYNGMLLLYSEDLRVIQVRERP